MSDARRLFESPLAVGVLGVVGALLVGLLLLWLTREPPCLRGHTEVRHIPATTSMQLTMSGEVTLHTEPAHDEAVFVCDQLELESVR